MKRATRIERLVDYYEDFAPDYVSTWKDIQHYEKPVRVFLRDLPPSVDVVGFDIAEGMLEIARKKRPQGAYHRHDYHLPIPRSWGRFDVALALGTLEFCDDLALVLKNLAGAMRPGGRMLVSIVERRPHVRMHERAARPLSDAELSGVSMYLYTFAEQTDAILRSGLLPRSYRLHPGWRHTEYDVDVVYALWDLEAPRSSR